MKRVIIGSPEAMSKEPSLEPPDEPLTEYAISQHMEGICLNPREYVLDGSDGDVKLFDTVIDAVVYLRAHWEDMPESIDDLDEYGVFIEPYK